MPFEHASASTSTPAPDASAREPSPDVDGEREDGGSPAPGPTVDPGCAKPIQLETWTVVVDDDFFRGTSKEYVPFHRTAYDGEKLWVTTVDKPEWLNVDGVPDAGGMVGLRYKDPEIPQEADFQITIFSEIADHNCAAVTRVVQVRIER